MTGSTGDCESYPTIPKFGSEQHEERIQNLKELAEFCSGKKCYEDCKTVHEHLEVSYFEVFVPDSIIRARGGVAEWLKAPVC